MLTTRKCPKGPEQCVGGQVVASANNYDVVGMSPFQVLVGSGGFFPVWGPPLRGLDQAAYPVPPTGACRTCTHPMRGSSPSSLSLFLKFCIFSLISCQVRIPLPRLPSEPATLSLLFSSPWPPLALAPGWAADTALLGLTASAREPFIVWAPRGSPETCLEEVAWPAEYEHPR